jgi:hypothetical protein
VNSEQVLIVKVILNNGGVVTRKVFWIMSFELWVMSYELWIMSYGLWIGRVLNYEL